ncbi:MAG: amino acid adenylation domain-containing protein, partial [Candidatus Aminicenantes bacterium]
PYEIETRISKFDMTLTCIEGRETLQWGVEYCTKLFKEETIEQYKEYFKQITAAVLDGGMGKKISGIEIISEEEKKRIVYDFNDTGTGYPWKKSIHQLLEEQVERTPDNIAVVGAHELHELHERASLEGTGWLATLSVIISITYKELNQKANQLAYLLKEKGVKPDSIVGLSVERSVEMIVAILGILKSGGAYLPIETGYPEERIRYMLADSQAKFLLAAPGTRIKDKAEEKGETGQPQGLPLEFVKIKKYIETVHEPSQSTLASTSTCQVSPANLAYVMYTSGTTGKPKGVMVTHQNVTNLVLGLKNRIYVSYSKPLAVCVLAPYVFDASVQQVFAALLLGHSLYIVPGYMRVDGLKLFEFYKRNNIDISDGTPTHLRLLLENINLEEKKVNLEMKHFIIGGEELGREIAKNFINRFGAKGLEITNVYGPTECCVDSTSYDILKENVDNHTSLPIGTPMPNQQVYILDSDNNLQPIGVTGELCIGGMGVSRGYLNRPELTAEKFRRDVIRHSSSVISSSDKLSKVTNDQCLMTNDSSPHYPITPLPQSPIYRTGDLARWLRDGNIEFLGRIDNQLKLRGYRIELGEIESVLQKHAHIKEAVVLSRSDGKEDKYLCAYMVSGKELEISEIREYLAKRLPEYMIPTYMMQVEKIPVTTNGKIDRKALPEPGIIPGTEYAAPRDEIEKKLAGIWGEVLGVKAPPGIDDNFFELGGHSLKATILVARIHKELSIRLPLAAIFKTPTIRGQAGSIKEMKEERFASIEPVEKKEYYLLSSAQQRLYILQQVELDSTVYNMPIFTHLPGEPEIEKLTGICQRLIHRHESLMTSFETVKDEPVQKVHDQVKFEIEYYDMKEVEEEEQTTDDRGQTTEGKPAPHPSSSSVVRRLSSEFIRPFDLSHAPLLRVGLMKLEENRHILMVDMHHIISDATSHQVLTKELTAMNKGEILPLLRIQYKDFSEWQNSKKEMENLKRQEQYWLKEFDGQIPLLDMPTDYKRSNELGFEGSTLAFKIDPPLTGQLRDMASQFNVTLMMLLLSGYNILLSKYTGQEDIVVGTVTAGRRHADLENIIGFFVNMLAIRTAPGKNKRYSQYLPEVKEKAINAIENQDYPFEELVSKLRVQREPGRHPLIDTVFVLADVRENAAEQEKQPTETSTSDPGTNPYKKTHFDLMLHAAAAEQSINMVFEYSTRLFKEATIRDFSKYYLEILRQLAEKKDIKLQDIKVSHDLQASKIESIKDDKNDWDLF